LREWRDRAAAVEHYQRRREGGRDAALAAGEIKVRAERALGQLDQQATPRGRPNGKDDRGDNFSPLGDLRPHTRAAWRRLGEVPDPDFDADIAKLRGDDNTGVTTAGVVRLARARDKQDIAAAIERHRTEQPKDRRVSVSIRTDL